jgi:hypothetical protein
VRRATGELVDAAQVYRDPALGKTRERDDAGTILTQGAAGDPHRCGHSYPVAAALSLT